MISHWPALCGLSEHPGRVATRRAVYGKVHRAPTDYRWIAWSAGFGESPAPLERELLLAGDDSAATFYGWRCSPESGAVAAKFYASRAYDAAGRPGVIEKQVLGVAPASGIPPAALAFLLLAELAPMDDGIWWESYTDPRWSTMNFHLQLKEEQSPSLSFDGLEDRIRQGIDELLDAVAENGLPRFYAQLLSQSGPAVLPINGKALSGLALAALLLPLEPAFTERISLVGGSTSKSLDPRRLENWNGIACPPGVVVVDPVQPLQRHLVEGARLAELLRGGIHPERVLELSPGGKYLVQFLKSSERWVVPGQQGGRSLSQVGPWPVVKDEAERGMLLDHVKTFIADLDRPEVSPDKRRHLATKADLLRALVLVLCPGPASLRAVFPPTTKFIPALCFANRIEIADWQELTNYSSSDFEALCDQSLSCLALVREVWKWLDECADGKGGDSIAQYATKALRDAQAKRPALHGL